MPDLAGLLVLLHDSDRRWLAVDAVVHTETDLVQLQTAVGIRAGAMPEAVADEAGHVERKLSARYRVRATRDPWRTRWDRLDHEGNDPNGIPPQLVLDDGEVQWEQLGDRIRRDRLRLPRTRALRAGGAMFLPGDIAATHRLAVSGADAIEGRTVWRFSASPRDPVPSIPSMSPELRFLTGELAIDAQTGIVLFARWFDRDTAVLSTVLTDVEVDPVIDPDVFRFHPPPDARITEGIRIPTRFVPAATLGILTAVASDRIARMFRRGPA